VKKNPSAGSAADYSACFSAWLSRDAPPAVSDPSETLALIAEHRLSLEHGPEGTGWRAMKIAEPDFTMLGCSCGRFYAGQRDEDEVSHWADGPTIGHAVRACVARIKSNQ
jgi:hypothetical protein